MIIIRFIWVYSLFFSTPSRAGSESHGGDTIRKLFNEAKEKAHDAAAEFATPNDIDSRDAEAISWIAANQIDLASDIEASELVWRIENDTATCAETRRNRNATIYLSYKICLDVQEIDSLKNATWLLIHEAVHHFNKEDEDFADRVALLIIESNMRTAEVATTSFKWESFATKSLWDGLHTGHPGPQEQSIQIGERIFVCCQNRFGAIVGLIYDPATGLSKSTSSLGSAPQDWNSYKKGTTLVWTGSHVFIMFAGVVAFSYDPQEDSSQQIRAPFTEPTYMTHALWTGSEVLLFGEEGPYWNAGARYDFSSNSWASMQMAPPPEVTARLTNAFWTGNKVLMYDSAAGAGWYYDPNENTWSSISRDGAPSPRRKSSIVLLNGKMFVWGGVHSGILNDGFVYDLAENMWSPMPQGAPGKLDPLTVVAGSKFIVWGGEDSSTGYIFDPVDQTWTRMAFDSSEPPSLYGAFGYWIGGNLVAVNFACRTELENCGQSASEGRIHFISPN